jgi:hypothetical protein
MGLDGRHRHINAKVRKERVLVIYLCYVGIDGNRLHMNAKSSEEECSRWNVCCTFIGKQEI